MKLTAEVMAGFVGSVLAKNYDDATATPDFHKECWELCCSDAKRVAIAAPRAHAKTTGVSVAYALANIVFRTRRFIVLVADTEAQSMMFLGSIKQELTHNQDLKEMFGLKVDENGDTVFVKDTASDIIVAFEDGHTARVMAKGAGQALRGMNWNGVRPDLVICDDMENDEQVMNKERREKLRNWFVSALLPMMSAKGIIRVVGTILHTDSLLENLMPEAIHRTIRQGGKRVNYLVDTGLRVSIEGYRWPLPWHSVRYRAHTPDYSQILWPEKYSAQYFQEIYNTNVTMGTPDKYAQEYLNTPLDEASTYFKRQDFLPRTEADRKKKLTYYITADLAISEGERADYSVFVIGGMDENRILHIVHIERARLDAREIVDTIIGLQRHYEPVAFGIEEMQVSKSIGPFLREEMIKMNTFPNLIKLKHGGKDKQLRARSIQARMRAQGVKFEKDSDWYPEFEDEIMIFPRGKHDDQVDAFAYLGMLLDVMVEAPTQQEQEEEEYEEELRSSGYSNQGRSLSTGY